jgi:hypothetical protein
MKKSLLLIVVLGCIGIVIWYVNGAPSNIQEISEPPSVSAYSVKPGDRIGAFVLAEINNALPEALTARFVGTTTVDVRCGYTDDIAGYGCEPIGESIASIPRFKEINKGSIQVFSIGGEYIVHQFPVLQKVFNLPLTEKRYMSQDEFVPLRIIISDYKISDGGTEVGPSATLVEVIEE